VAQCRHIPVPENARNCGNRSRAYGKPVPYRVGMSPQYAAGSGKPKEFQVLRFSPGRFALSLPAVFRPDRLQGGPS